MEDADAGSLPPRRLSRSTRCTPCLQHISIQLQLFLRRGLPELYSGLRTLPTKEENFVPSWSQQHGAAGNVYREMQNEYEQYSQQVSATNVMTSVRFVASKAEFTTCLPKCRRLVVVDFMAQWCGPCQDFTPITKPWPRSGAIFVAVDVDENPEVAAACGIVCPRPRSISTRPSAPSSPG